MCKYIKSPISNICLLSVNINRVTDTYILVYRPVQVIGQPLCSMRTVNAAQVLYNLIRIKTKTIG